MRKYRKQQNRRSNVHHFMRPMTKEQQEKLMNRLNWVCTHLEEFWEQVKDCQPKIKRHYPRLNVDEIVKVNPIPRNKFTVSDLGSKVVVNLLKNPFEPNEATIEARKLAEGIKRKEEPMKQDHFKFKLEVSPDGQDEENPDLSLFDITYYSANNENNPYIHPKIKDSKDEVFDSIAETVVEDYLFSRLSNRSDFIFGTGSYDTEDYDVESLFGDDKIREKLQALIRGIFKRVFNHDFFHNSILDKTVTYDYIFDLTFNRCEESGELQEVNMEVQAIKQEEE